MSSLPLTQEILESPLICTETRKADKTGYLVVKDCQYEILLGETKIGRNASVCTIILESETVSQVHAVIESEGPEDSFLYDNNSTNKTKIGKMVLKPYCRYKISNNDLITLGSISSKFIVISHNNCNSSIPLLTSNTSALGIKDADEDNVVNKLSLKDNDCNTQEIGKGTLTEIFKSPSKFPKSQKKSVNEPPPILDIFNQSRQCELINSQEQTKQIRQYYYSSLDISDEIFNATTQCEFPVDSEIFNLSTQYVIQNSTQTSKTEGLVKEINFDSDSNASDIFNHANKIQKFPSYYKKESNDMDIFNCSTQFEVNSQSVAVIVDRHAHQNLKNKPFAKLVDNNISDEIFDLPTQIIDQEKVTENETQLLSRGLIILKKDNVNIEGKEDAHFLEDEKSSDQKKSREFLECETDEDEVTQIQFQSENEMFTNNQKLYEVQTVIDSNINQCSKANEVDFKKDDTEIEQHVCIKNELKLIDLGDEIESDPEVKTTLKPSVKKENSPSQEHFINSGCHKDSNSSNLTPENEESRRSLSESSDRTTSDLDIIEVQNDFNLNVKISKNINDNEDFGATNIFLIDNDLRNSSEKALSDSDCSHFNGSSNFMKQIKNNFCEKSTAIPPCLRQSPSKLTKSMSVSFDYETDSDIEKFGKIVNEVREYKKLEISNEENTKKSNDDNSNESESLIKVIEDSSILYDNILISENEENIYQFNKLPIKVETNTNNLSKSDSSPTLLSSHPVFDALSEINDILAKKFSRESSTESENKINTDLQVFVNEIPNQELLLDAEKVKAFTSKTVISDSDETDCELAENYIKDKRWKEEGEKARNASPATKIEQISFNESIYDGEEMEFGQFTLQLAPTPEFKRESEESFLSDPENCENFHEETGESDSKRSLKNRIKSSSNIFHKDEIKKRSFNIVSYFNISKPDGIRINESPLKRTQQMNSFDTIPKKKSKSNTRNVAVKEVKTGSKKLQRRKSCDSASCMPESNLKVRHCIMSCKKGNSNTAPSKQRNNAEISSAQMKSNKKGRNECRLISEVDLSNIMCPGKDGFEISLIEKEEIKEEVKRNMRQKQSNADHFGSGSGKHRRMRAGPSTEKMESNSSFTKIIFTGIESAAYVEAITQLGGKIINDLKEGQILVTDRARRTVKFLCAVARGIPIVSPKWLTESEKKCRLINPWSFLLKDSKAEKLWDFNLKSSLDKARKHKLLRGYSVFATESTKPPVPEILDIVACCGGIPLVSLPDVWPEKSIVLTCNEDKKSWPPRKHRHVKIVHYEIILNGVLKQLMDFKSYKLR